VPNRPVSSADVPKDLADAFDPTLQDTSVLAQSSAATVIANVIEQTLGVEIMQGVLRDGGTREHESSADPELPKARGFEILSELTALAGALTTNSSRCRLLTSGEKSNLALANGVNIRNIDRVRICNGGFLGIQGYLMAPNGHIYVGTASGVAWQPDFSAATVPIRHDRSLIVHEMFHVYQNRNPGCRVTNGCTLALRIIPASPEQDVLAAQSGTGGGTRGRSIPAAQCSHAGPNLQPRRKVRSPAAATWSDGVPGQAGLGDDERPGDRGGPPHTVRMAFGWIGRESNEVELASLQLLSDVHSAIVQSCGIQAPPAKITRRCKTRHCKNWLSNESL